MEVFREKEATKRPKRYQPLNFLHSAAAAPALVAEGKNDAMEICMQHAAGQQGADAGGVSLDVFCNPNMHSSAFNATALVTLTMVAGTGNASTTDGGQMRVVTECDLSALKADVDEYLTE